MACTSERAATGTADRPGQANDTGDAGLVESSAALLLPTKDLAVDPNLQKAIRRARTSRGVVAFGQVMVLLAGLVVVVFAVLNAWNALTWSTTERALNYLAVGFIGAFLVVPLLLAIMRLLTALSDVVEVVAVNAAASATSAGAGPSAATAPTVAPAVGDPGAGAPAAAPSSVEGPPPAAEGASPWATAAPTRKA